MNSSSLDKKTAPISQIRQEYARLQEVESILTDIWNTEIQAYEYDDGVTESALDTSSSFSHGCHRNHPNFDGTITDRSVFPYHNALYPLLDCYDSIKQEASTTNLKHPRPPSDAPNPFTRNGHRRSKFSPRLDSHGYHIEELEFLEGHLPNSASAIMRALMPQNRREEYLQYVFDGRPDDVEKIVPEALHEEDDQPEIHTPRFWKKLLNNNPELISSNVSLAPEDEGGYNDEQEFDDDVMAQVQNAHSARDFSFLTWWEHKIVSNKTQLDASKEVGLSILVTTASTPGEHSVECLFATSPADANLVLLRVLKHAMSDLQRDFRLARAILLLMADLHLLDNPESEEGDGIETLRRILTIISSEYIHCKGSCHEWFIDNGGVHNNIDAHTHHNLHNVDDDESIDLEEESLDRDNDEWEYDNNPILHHSQALDPPNHYCSDWFQFLGSLSTTIAYGIPFMSRLHANVFCACALREIDHMVGAIYTADNTYESDDNVPLTNLHYRGILKQNLFALNNSEDSSSERKTRQLRVNFLVAIVNGLKRHAIVHRSHLETYLKDLNTADCQSICDEIKKSLAAFNICVDAIVDIGERIITKLPTNSTTSLLGGAVVRALLEAHLEISIVSSVDENELYFAQSGNNDLRSVIDPLRYADSIANASENYARCRSTSYQKGSDNMNPDIISRVINRISQDVHDIVKALFIRDLVDLRISGFGYGDFCVWLGLPISPREPHLFMHYKNFPDVGQAWITDEEENDLDYTGVASRYDFTLMLLLKEWNAPWNPGSHLSFSQPFRSAIRQLATIAHRFGVPSDIVVTVNSFLPRSWWPDENESCWCRDCQLLRIQDEYGAKFRTRLSNWKDDPVTLPQPSPTRSKSALYLTSCKCGVAIACNNHMRQLYHEGHKRYCGLPPFRMLTEEDHAFIRDILNETNTAKDENDDEDSDEFENSDGNSDHDDDWESVDSDEDLVEKKTRTQKIRKFFMDESYQHIRREVLPFEDFY